MLQTSVVMIATAPSQSPIAERPELPVGAVVLPASAAPKLLHQCSRVTPAPGDGSWQPDGRTIYELEDALLTFLPDQKVRWRNQMFPKDYTRQYIGYIKNGHRMIYGNFVAVTGDQLHGLPVTEPLILCDGSSDAFGVEYDVDARRVTHFALNGAI